MGEDKSRRRVGRVPREIAERVEDPLPVRHIGRESVGPPKCPVERGPLEQPRLEIIGNQGCTEEGELVRRFDAHIGSVALGELEARGVADVLISLRSKVSGRTERPLCTQNRPFRC